MLYFHGEWYDAVVIKHCGHGNHHKVRIPALGEAAAIAASKGLSPDNRGGLSSRNSGNPSIDHHRIMKANRLVSAPATRSSHNNASMNFKGKGRKGVSPRVQKIASGGGRTSQKKDINRGMGDNKD